MIGVGCRVGCEAAVTGSLLALGMLLPYSTSPPDGAAHMVAGDRNDIFSDAVIDFLNRTVPVAGVPVQPPHEPHPHHEGPEGDVIDVP